ncbi:MAG: hypothetical protein V4543_12045 [Bacteroidota bacterium]
MMRAHKGMRPQDIVILLKLVALGNKPWTYRSLAADLYMSVSEVAESLNRSALARLYNDTSKKVNRLTFMEFIQYGFSHVFPQIPGNDAAGIATAHGHPFYKERIISNNSFVWPNPGGKDSGPAVMPLHKGVPLAVQTDELLYKLLAEADILRFGRAREKNLAIEELKKEILS